MVLIESKKDAQSVKKELQETLSVLGFSYICSLFLLANDKFILHYDKMKKRKQKMQEKYKDNIFFAEVSGRKSVLCFRNIADWIMIDQ